MKSQSMINFVLLLVVPIHGFVIPSSSSSFYLMNDNRRRMVGMLKMAAASPPPPLPDTNDPLELLGWNMDKDGIPSAKDIKRMYKRRAMMYHPDMVCTTSSTDEEKKQASDTFARIVAAYDQLTNPDTASKTPASTSSNANTYSNNGWKPPHRRSSSTYSSSTNPPRWEDFMPKDEDDDKYDTNGDSFEAIFRDLVTGVATSSTGSTLISEFLDFLEGTTSSTNNFGRTNKNNAVDDEELNNLLTYGSIQDVKKDMEDTQLLLQQLKQKEANLQNEINSSTIGRSLAEQQLKEESQARLQIVQQYQQRAQSRLYQLQNRYKELRNNTNDYTNNNNYNQSSTQTTQQQQQQQTTTTSSSTSRESFGSSYGRRRRGAARNRQNSSTSDYNTNTQSTSNTSAQRNQQPFSQRQTTTTRQTPNTNRSITTNTNTSNVPPHRRSTSSYNARSDKQRLREIKVDEEFDKLKEELGL